MPRKFHPMPLRLKVAMFGRYPLPRVRVQANTPPHHDSKRKQNHHAQPQRRAGRRHCGSCGAKLSSSKISGLSREPRDRDRTHAIICLTTTAGAMTDAGADDWLPNMQDEDQGSQANNNDGTQDRDEEHFHRVEQQQQQAAQGDDGDDGDDDDRDEQRHQQQRRQGEHGYLDDLLPVPSVPLPSASPASSAADCRAHGSKSLSLLRLPVLPLPDVVLVPGTTLALRHLAPQYEALLTDAARDAADGKWAASGDDTTGFVAVLPLGEGIGTAACVDSIRHAGEFAVVLRGCLPIKLEKLTRTPDGMAVGSFHVLGQAVSVPVRHVGKAAYPAARRHRQNTRIPRCALRQYDVGSLVLRLHRRLVARPEWERVYNAGPLSGIHEHLPNRTAELRAVADRFSFWLTANISLEDETRLGLLSASSLEARLHMLLGLLAINVTYTCQCGAAVAEEHDLFQLASAAGTVGAYVNPHGVVHQTVTFRHATNVFPVGAPSTESSWFEGYAWAITVCASCTTHLGWLFTWAGAGSGKPASFWGLRCGALHKTTSTT
eukprot:m.80800 g.80800  ORF g.80800 m.80800 type:complete len:547 (-) comp14672_c0_seq5:127-1767(-)